MSAAATAQGPAQSPRGTTFTAATLLVPILLINAIGFMLPVANLAVISVSEIRSSGAMTGGWSIAKWTTVATDPFYWELLANTVRTSLIVTILTLIVSYPIALCLHRMNGAWKSILLVLVISPLLLSSVVRTYGWIAILSDRGLVNSALAALGAQEPFRLMFNLTGVMIGLTEILMPYMILALLAGFGRLDPRVEEAAATLGAPPYRVFWRVVLPLSLPGVALGSLLTFVLAISSFITPKLLGGGRVFLLATEVYDQAIVTLDWPLAATLSIIVLVVFGLALAVYTRILRQIG
ncbi:MAG: ABC transporter permease [Phreatobacter sp.]|jgi:putative spermidine/putrescine transport system permease protein|nr:ABC transporter permease [Phreatobacter sp.]